MNDLATSLRASTMGTVLYDADMVVDHYPATRFDDDGREEKTLVALLDMVYNQALAVASLAPSVVLRYRAFYFVVGDAVTPGIVRSAVAAWRSEPFSCGRFVQTQRTVTDALRQARRTPMEFRLPGDGPVHAAATP